MPRRPITSAILICSCFLLYSVVRYLLFEGVSIQHFPLFILNKALSWSGLVLIGLAPFYTEKVDRKLTGLIGFVLTILHTLISFVIFSPAYYSKFYVAAPEVSEGRLTWQAELSMLTGILAVCGACWLFVSTLQQNGNGPNGNATSNQKWLTPGLGRAVLFLSALHLFFMGYQGWTDVSRWAKNGYLPPITLLAFLMAIALIAIRFIVKINAGKSTG